jgi:hypothetical protein
MGRSEKLLIHLGIVLVVALLAGFFALITAGAIGGVAMGVAPEFTFRQVASLICPEGSRLAYDSIQRSYHAPGESEPIVECIREDGTTQDALLRAIFIVLGVTFLGIFLITFLGLLIPIEIIILIISRRRSRDQSSGSHMG